MTLQKKGSEIREPCLQPGRRTMTAAELRVLETRMDLLETVLQELIEQVRRMQPSSWDG
jgi:hypothetical protein